MQGYFRKRCKCPDKKKCKCPSWSFTLDLPGVNTKTGRRKQKTASGFATRKDAELECAKLIVAIENGEYQKLSKDTLGKYLVDFMENVSKQQVRITTYEMQMVVVRNHIIPDLGSNLLNDLKPMDIRKFYQQKLDKGLSSGYIRNMHTTLTKVFKSAHEEGMTAKNIMTMVKSPRSNAKEIKTWSIDQINRFLDNVTESNYYIIYVIAAYTGMRKGEILALRNEDLDFENGKINVKQTLSRVKNKLLFHELKTKGSKRSISITEFVINALKKQKKKQSELMLGLGMTAHLNAQLVITTRGGDPIRPTDVNHNMDEYIKKFGMDRITFHGWRHSHATILLQSGENPKVVSERLGHAKVNMLLNTYSHVMPDMQTNLANKFESIMNRSIN